MSITSFGGAETKVLNPKSCIDTVFVHCMNYYEDITKIASVNEVKNLFDE